MSIESMYGKKLIVVMAVLVLSYGYIDSSGKAL